jgi:hypothetical protein
VTCYLPIIHDADSASHYPTAEQARDAVSPTALIGVLQLTPNT